MDGLVPVVKKLRVISWEWTKASAEGIASDLGLLDRTTGSDTWVGYRSPAPGFPSPGDEGEGVVSKRRPIRFPV